MKKLILLILAICFYIPAYAETTMCNKCGGQKVNAWFAFQTCDFLTKKAITPVVATQIGKAEMSSDYFNIYVTSNEVIVRNSTPGMHPPIVKKVTLVVDSGELYSADIYNYGFYPVVESPIREAYISGDNYNSLISELKSGKELRVLWEQEDFIHSSYQIIFSLEDARITIEHVQKNN